MLSKTNEYSYKDYEYPHEKKSLTTSVLDLNF